MADPGFLWLPLKQTDVNFWHVTQQLLYVCVYVCVCMCAHLRAYVYVLMHICLYIYICDCVHLCDFWGVHTSTAWLRTQRPQDHTLYYVMPASVHTPLSKMWGLLCPWLLELTDFLMREKWVPDMLVLHLWLSSSADGTLLWQGMHGSTLGWSLAHCEQ